jgi:hypothetical protein
MKKFIILNLLASAICLTACKKHFEDINTNPNVINKIDPNLILPGIEGSLSYAMGGESALYAGILSQQCFGANRKWEVIEKYAFVGSDVDNLYRTNIYSNILMDIQNLKEIATKNNYDYYNGVAKTIEAYTLLFVADFWDSSPYSEAFQGVTKLQPKYDSQEELYATVFSLLAEARVHFGKPDGGLKVPASDDLMYNGNISKWAGLSYFIEARANLRLAKADASKYQTVLSLLNNGLVSDFSFPYDGGNFIHPIYSFNTNYGDVQIGTKMNSLLTSYNDPRTALYTQSFDGDNTYLTANKTHVIASIIEQEFMKAECNFKTGGSAAAKPFYLNAITLALERDGISPADIATYLGQNAIDPGTISLELIMNQKYLALFLEHESFTDWRRTGFPSLTPNTGTQIPRKFPTPQSEQNLNGANAPTSTIYKAVTWDI